MVYEDVYHLCIVFLHLKICPLMFTNQTERINFASAKNIPNLPGFLGHSDKIVSGFFPIRNQI
jgi:hypothetical protein